jgi:hypothetical protein
MTASSIVLAGERVYLLDDEGPLIAGADDVVAMLGDVLGSGAGMIAIPVRRLAPEFFVLRTKVAGDVVQKLVNYRLRVAVVGDIDEAVARSSALADWVREANRRSELWFVRDLAELERRLGGGGGGSAD